MEPMYTNQSKIFAIGDIHGNIKGLEQVLIYSNFDIQNDTLIVLGDVADGPYPYIRECVDLLLTIPNRIDIMGNHDDWFREYIMTGKHPDGWKQGGFSTMESYMNIYNMMIIPNEHQKFFNYMHYYYEYENMLFVHGGFNRKLPIRGQHSYRLMWNRSLFEQAMSCGNKQVFKIEYDKVFIGHTSTQNWNTTKPILAGQKVWNLDTGSGSLKGRLTLMNIKTEEYYQSDVGINLYPKINK